MHPEHAADLSMSFGGCGQACRRARGLTGIDAPYEAPENPDLAFDTTGGGLDELVGRVLDLLGRAEAGGEHG
ncbi:adenylyl-sulfate kinase [Rhodococcus triatomae]|nr:sulfate adenylyltransferase subunit 1/adenylyl-sulfate kinase [Rhodococcus triatomae BKS 15-14]